MFLVNPVLRFYYKSHLKEKVILLMDDSNSMNQKIGDSPKRESYKALLDKLKQRAGNAGYETEICVLSDFSKQNNTTRLFPFYENIKKLNTEGNVKAIYLFSDGWIHDEDFSFLQSYQIPVNPVIQKYQENLSDVAVTELFYNKNMYRNEKNTIRARIQSHEYDGDVKVELILENRRMAEKEVSLKKDSIADLEFDIEFKEKGLQNFEVSIKHSDSNPGNNEYPGAVQVLDTKQKILILTDQLTADLRFVNMSIISQSRLITDMFLYNNSQYYKNGKVANPVWSDYSAVVLINNGRMQINRNDRVFLENLVTNGGGVFIMGYPISALSDMMPASLSNIKGLFTGSIRFTPESSQYKTFTFDEKTVSNIPPLKYMYVKSSSNSQILARIDNESQNPYIIYQKYGLGSILYIAGFDLWKWKTYSDNDNYNNFIENVLYWLTQSNSERFRAYTSKMSYFNNENVSINLEAYDEKLNPLENISPKIKLYQNGKLLKEDFLTRNSNNYNYEINNIASGKYQYTITDAKTKLETSNQFVVNKKSQEDFDHGINLPLLNWIATTTQGKPILSDTIGDYGMEKAGSELRKRVLEMPVYKKWYMIALFLSLLSAEYFLRKRWGLL